MKQGRPPNKHDLKESGDIENHSNLILLLHEPPDATPDSLGRKIVWAQVAKGRDAMATPWEGRGALRLRWCSGMTRFEDSWAELGDESE